MCMTSHMFHTLKHASIANFLIFSFCTIILQYFLPVLQLITTKKSCSTYLQWNFKILNWLSEMVWDINMLVLIYFLFNHRSLAFIDHLPIICMLLFPFELPLNLLFFYIVMHIHLCLVFSNHWALKNIYLCIFAYPSCIEWKKSYRSFGKRTTIMISPC